MRSAPKVPPNRQALHAYLTPEGHARIQDFADRGGISMTGVLESMSEMMDDGSFTDAQMEQWTKKARYIDAQRRKRSKP
jgi:predicted ArsR family transcriptional regulator